jgi:hypothetical protein
MGGEVESWEILLSEHLWLKHNLLFLYIKFFPKWGKSNRLSRCPNLNSTACASRTQAMCLKKSQSVGRGCDTRNHTGAQRGCCIRAGKAGGC